MRIEELFEVFDKVGNWIWKSESGNEWIAEFRVNSSVYEFVFNHYERGYYWTANFFPKGGTTNDITDRHEALLVLSTAVAILNEFTQKADQDFGDGIDGPTMIEFAASSDGVDRTSAYEKILNRKLSSNYEFRKTNFYGNTSMFIITHKDI